MDDPKNNRDAFEARAKMLIDQMSRNAAAVTRSLGLPSQAEVDVFSALYGPAYQPLELFQWIAGATGLMQFSRVITPSTDRAPAFSLAPSYMGSEDPHSLQRSGFALGSVEILFADHDPTTEQITLTFRLREPFPDTPVTVRVYQAKLQNHSSADSHDHAEPDDSEHDPFEAAETADHVFELSAEDGHSETSFTLNRADYGAGQIEIEQQA